MFRRGKLSVLSGKDDRVKIINERINVTEKHFGELCNAFRNVAQRLAKQRDTHDELAKCVKAYSDDEEINESLQEGLRSFANALTILGDYMDINVHRLEWKLVNELAQFENVAKSTRENLRTAVIARDKEVLKQRQMLEIKTKFSANNSAADSELLKAKLEVNRTNKEIDELSSNFEQRKLSDLKTMLHDFLLISMKYHTKALEVLSASYYDISNVDDKSDLLEFQRLLRTKQEQSTRRSSFKRGLRSQSMESLERDQLLSPLQRSAKLSKSNRNLDEFADDVDVVDEEEEEEDDDDDGDEDEDEDEDESDEDEEDEDDGADSQTPSEEAAAAKSKPMQLKQTFKASTHVVKQAKPLTRRSPFEAKGVGIPSLAKRDSTTADNRDGGRLVTLVESKKK